MSTVPAPRAGVRDSDGSLAHNTTRRVSTETKAAFKTTEFVAFLGVLAAI